MLTTDDLRALLAEPADPGVSIFMPTHVAGREISQDPIRLRKLIDQAIRQLVRVGYRRPAAENLVAPAKALTGDEHFWRHQDRGLAVFAARNRLNWYRVPLELEEAVMVGRHFHIKPLLPLVSLPGPVQQAAAERLQQLMGEGDDHATARPGEVIRAAHDGRVDTLFLRQGATLWGHYDETANRVIPHERSEAGDEDLIDYAAAHTLLKDGQVSVLGRGELPGVTLAAALLRY